MTVSTPGSFPAPVLRTKLHRPVLGQGFVRRGRLNERLDAGERGVLTVVSAPAGYGKSTQVSDWAGSLDCPCAWVSLDEQDSDPAQFLAYFVAAAQGALPGTCEETAALLQGDLPPIPVVARALANELDAIDAPWVLVLDDYHRIETSSEVHELLGLLLGHPPRSLRLVLVTRRDPPLPLHALRAAGRLTEVRMRDLLFTNTETAALLEKAGFTLSGDAQAHLERQVEGWPVGLRLAVLALRDAADPEAFVRELHGGVQHVQEYLFEEVVSGHSPEMQEWLLNTSILDRFSPALCEALCTGGASSGVPGLDGRRFVDRLQEGDLFAIHLDARGEWVRYHHLFQQLLQGLLERRHPERVTPLHARASAWFEGAGLLDEAIGHSLEAGDTARAATLVAQAGPELVAREECSRMERLLGRLPREVVGGDPMLLIFEAWTHHVRVRMPEWAASLQQIEASLSGSTPPPSDAEGLRACLDALRSSYCYYTSDLEQALACSARALEGIPPELQRLRVHAAITRAISLQATGALEDALSLLTSALAEGRAQSANSQVPLLSAVSGVHWQSAQLAEALQAARRIDRASGGSGVGTHQRWARIYQAMPLYQLNELAEVEELLRKTAENPLGQHAVLFVDEATVYALTCQARGRPEEAGRLADVLVDLGEETGADRLLRAGGALRAELAVRQGRLAHAEHWANRFEAKPLEVQYGFSIPELTQARVWVERNTAESRRDAARLLERIVAFARATHFRTVLIPALALQGLLQARGGDEAAALDTLAESVSEAEPGGGLRFFLDLGDPMADLLRRLARERGDSAFLKSLRLASGEPAAPVPGRPPTPAAPSASGAVLLDALTTREREVLNLLAGRLRDKEIAEALFISTETVNTHLKHVYQKLDARNRRQAVAHATELGLIGSDRSL